jgi:type I site-specific restriction endonuclease
VIKEFSVGELFVDYILFADDGKLLAVVEAKKSSKDAELGREQAKQYCDVLQDDLDIELPFCFYTNGHDIFFWDIRNAAPRKIHSFPKLHSFQCFDDINNVFMMYNISFQKNYMYKYASKTTVPYMNKTTCNKIPIILPPKPLQDKFATIVQQVANQTTVPKKP